MRALVGIKGDRVHHSEPAWIVTAFFNVIGPGNGVLYHKISIVVDAITGKYQYAYVSDPDGAQMRALQRQRKPSTVK